RRVLRGGGGGWAVGDPALKKKGGPGASPTRLSDRLTRTPNLAGLCDVPGCQNVKRKPSWPTRCSGRRKSPEYDVGCKSCGSGAPVDGTTTRARKPLGLIELNRLNTSPMISARGRPPS